MRAFATLYSRLDSTTKTNRKLGALRDYFSTAAPADAAWAVHFLVGRTLKRLINSRELQTWGAAAAGIPDWLFLECYSAVGDMAETLALLLPPPAESTPLPLHYWVEAVLARLGSLAEDEKRAALVNAWQSMDREQRLVWNKLITGGFRVGVSHKLVVRALAEAGGLPAATVAHRLMGDWTPSAEFFQQLLAKEGGTAEVSRPYPFFLAYPLEDPPESLGSITDWQCEWKWDGIRAQLLRRQGKTYLWSRGEELVTERFPEISEEAERLPEGTALDGEILAWKDGAVLPFALLQQRIGRKKLGPKILDDVPVALLTFDILEKEGQDVRAMPLSERRKYLAEILERLFLPRHILLSPMVEAASWEALAAAREGSRTRNVEGVMLKRLDSPYGVGRQRGPWWKWKINPHTVDAVLIYAQLGHGRRASLHTDYTFGVWHDGELVPFAKAYSGLTDEEIREVDRFVRNHTLERFGPVRRVEPTLVFEIAFEGIQKSTRHKSGIAVRFPRMARWRHDKKAEEADTLERLKGMIQETH
ncbi:MAG: ATP-dependent DNA ligase [Planctomycetes bacterium]|nr:ATP-dependent DNA ligase [Planctomycetota bacterium]